ncbi:MAG: hypothetical protein Q8O19_05175 [Rectinemataceae bacterium]|nr:hypothetical protein [Rectinemataceae bacterium]
MAGRKNVPAVISAMGILLDIVVALVNALRRRSADIGEMFYRLGTVEGKMVIEEIAEKVADVLGKFGGVITAPEGGRIRIVTIPVDESRDWRDAISPLSNTSPDSNVWKVGDQYPAVAGAKGKRKIILVNFGEGSATSSETAIAWGKERGLRLITPREAFAVGEHKPNLHTELGLSFMAVVSLVTCSFSGKSRVCYSWWRGAERRAGLSWFGGGWDGDSWFGFVRE